MASPEVTITIHRGTHQIGGCVTEIASGSARAFIDIGANLAETDAKLPAIEGLTVGGPTCSALFLTHYHGDHIGCIDSVLPHVPVYMGATAKAIQLNYAARVQSDKMTSFEKINTFMPLDHIKVGDITVTPLMIDHSAFDAYMFLVEAEGCRVLHTGDFRLHGVRGGKTLKMLSCYAKDIDYIICEGTTLNRKGEPPMSEYQLQKRAVTLMQSTPYVFVLCSSTNIDRIAAFYHATPSGRLFVCDDYQKKLLKAVHDAHAVKSRFYNFSAVYNYAPNLDSHMAEKGFCMLVRQGESFHRVMEKYKNDSLLIYSMWTGYLDERAKNQGLCDFVAPHRYHVLHTSGHASAVDLKRLYDAVKPKHGLIPIHTDEPEKFREIIPDGKIIMLHDREILPVSFAASSFASRM